jgi:hypothetical protein
MKSLHGRACRSTLCWHTSGSSICQASPAATGGRAARNTIPRPLRSPRAALKSGKAGASRSTPFARATGPLGMSKPRRPAVTKSFRSPVSSRPGSIKATRCPPLRRYTSPPPPRRILSRHETIRICSVHLLSRMRQAVRSPLAEDGALRRVPRGQVRVGGFLPLRWLWKAVRSPMADDDPLRCLPRRQNRGYGCGRQNRASAAVRKVRYGLHPPAESKDSDLRCVSGWDEEGEMRKVRYGLHPPATAKDSVLRCVLGSD